MKKFILLGTVCWYITLTAMEQIEPPTYSTVGQSPYATGELLPYNLYTYQKKAQATHAPDAVELGDIAPMRCIISDLSMEELFQLMGPGVPGFVTPLSNNSTLLEKRVTCAILQHKQSTAALRFLTKCLQDLGPIQSKEIESITCRGNVEQEEALCNMLQQLAQARTIIIVPIPFDRNIQWEQNIIVDATPESDHKRLIEFCGFGDATEPARPLIELVEEVFEKGTHELGVIAEEVRDGAQEGVRVVGLCTKKVLIATGYALLVIVILAIAGSSIYGGIQLIQQAQDSDDEYRRQLAQQNMTWACNNLYPPGRTICLDSANRKFGGGVFLSILGPILSIGGMVCFFTWKHRCCRGLRDLCCDWS